MKLLIAVVLMVCGHQAFADTLDSKLPGFYFNHEQLKFHQNQYFQSNDYPYSYKQFPMLYRSRDYSQADYGFPKRNKFIQRKLFNEHAVQATGKDFFIGIDPLFNIKTDPRFGLLQENSINTRGIQALGQIGEKVFFHSVFFENQAFLPFYLNRYALEYGVFPGMGRTKPFKTNGIDYSMSAAIILVKLHRNFSITAGHGKHFVGEGFRSMLISDAAYSYPFAKYQLDLAKGKIRVESMYTLFYSLNRVPATLSSEAQFQRKIGSFHSVSFRPNQKLTFTLLESNIWKNWDSTGTTSPSPFMYFPLMGVSFATQQNSGNNKSMLGLNTAYTPTKWAMIYSQINYDPQTTAGVAYQLGARFSTLFYNRISTYIQPEWNSAPINAFEFPTALQSYTHFNQSLAHPLNSDFSEFVLLGGVSLGRWQLNGKYIRANQGLSATDFSVGNSALNNFGLSGISRSLTHVEGSLQWMINQKSQTCIAIGYHQRNEISVGNGLSSNWLFVSLSSRIHNLYLDF